MTVPKVIVVTGREYGRAVKRLNLSRNYLHLSLKTTDQMNQNKREVSAVREYLKAIEVKNNRLWRVGSDGIPKTEVNGEWITSEEFMAANPIPNPVNFYGGKENPDGTRAYLY